MLCTCFVDESVLAPNLFDQSMQSRVQRVADEECEPFVAMIDSAGVARKKRCVNACDDLL